MHVAGRLAAAGIDAARGEAWLLLGAATGQSRAALMAGVPVTLSAGQEARLEALMRRRLAREPIAYILGEKEFWSLRFEVGPAVLIPRPETETVVETALAQVADRAAPLRILDLGTGSGCLLLALLSELPSATGVGTDISAAALAIAARNASALGLAGRSELLRRTEELMGWVKDGSLRVRIDRQLPLAAAAEAHAELEGRRTTGKVLLAP